MKEIQNLDTDDPLLHWAKEQIKNWRRAIELMQSERMGTSEMRHGRITDTTAETIAEYSVLAVDLEVLVAKHEHQKVQKISN